ncbi:hypothetical protein K432DRAFT_382622 [Lepidopterella palustris CBS 459.81]|uniref:Uncharacterized protein n=1 Tax=Lepidopterella palustris CBS 459.81 TaxID=1314670 RepID=A0A8E2JF10_9PEZI|nr:hypothetical protein K432DRAFT_382622 [Lepidopterella palustris CBS 459.81]
MARVLMMMRPGLTTAKVPCYPTIYFFQRLPKPPEARPDEVQRVRGFRKYAI